LNTTSRANFACEDVSPVALAVDEQFFLSQLHQGVADGGIAVGVELHGVAHDVRHLVVASVIEALHRVQDASLHGLQAIVEVRHGTLKDDVRGIVQKPVLIHAAQLVFGRFGLRLGGAVVGVSILGRRGDFFAWLVYFLKIVAHIYLNSLMMCGLLWQKYDFY
jgi:hypothetical protein